ncbi:hypothetical protein LTR36_001522 [Oleoguttula mirabilis]|uniref:Uncharacterized protein n=1 Tax=Oleoguttula mirabilis TaxID=1507867 RepID=A0AAV9JNB8_9PEZI|nr:hypothetical protein LTR36_001522 [Oleoguttula mirabilis]
MKYAITLLTAAVAVAAAQPHRHGHPHLHEAREAMPNPVADVVVVPGPTEIAYVLNGMTISEADVQEGIKNGTLVWENGGGVESAAAEASETSSSYVASSSSNAYVWSASTASTEAASTPSSTYRAWSSSEAATTSWSSPSSSSSSYSSSASSSSSATSSSSSSSSSSSGSDSSFDSDSTTGIDTAFPDGELDCSTFPSDYGAVAVSWMGLGGWTGIQQPGDTLSTGFSDITTVTSDTCSGSSCCTDGSYCSYACPAGYQKSQWPTTQGATGQSVGGILCKNGKLQLTNTAMSSNLCMSGADQVTVLVKNELSSNAAVCRTDYPGTEGETVPLDTQAGTTTNLTCPDADNYYTWEGGYTSAQYYVNPEGVSVKDACQWGSSDNPWGNYAPLNLGVGYSSGSAWLSIFQNSPTTTATLDFTVEITGDGLSGTCRYSNGQYCSGDDYDTCSSTTGCTVSLSSGTATFVFSSS